MSLSRLARLALLSQQQGYASLPLQLLPAAAGAQQRFYQAAVQHAADDAAASSQAVPSKMQQQQQQQQQQHSRMLRPPQQEWVPRRALPPATHYGVKVTIKAHDLKFVKMASTVIRDLMLVNFAPKSKDVVSAAGKGAAGVPYVNLALPVGDAALPTKRTHWTVIRGPHVHKTSREQFARTTHQRVVSYATNNLSELTWFLDSLKLYKFIGVELVIRVTSSSHLLPTTAAQQAAADQPLLASHKQRFAHLFGAAAPSSSKGQQQQQPQQGQDGSSSYAALQQSLQGLRDSMHQALLQQRLKLSAAPNYARWREGMEGAAVADAAVAAAGGPMSTVPAAAAAAADLPGRALEDMVRQQLQGISEVAAAGKAAQQQHQAALLAAVDKAVLQLKLDVLDRHKFFPFLMAFYQLGGQKVPAPEWMHAMLKYGKMAQQQVEASQAAAALQAYQQYGQANKALLLVLLQQWYKAADTASRQELVLPKPDRVDDILPPPDSQ